MLCPSPSERSHTYAYATAINSCQLRHGQRSPCPPPLKPTTIPRLELKAAVLAANLSLIVKQELRFCFPQLSFTRTNKLFYISFTPLTPVAHYQSIRPNMNHSKRLWAKLPLNLRIRCSIQRVVDSATIRSAKH
jgi:hypothetical protein